jgi:hypothetical protein
MDIRELYALAGLDYDEMHPDLSKVVDTRPTIAELAEANPLPDPEPTVPLSMVRDGRPTTKALPGTKFFEGPQIGTPTGDGILDDLYSGATGVASDITRTLEGAVDAADLLLGGEEDDDDFLSALQDRLGLEAEALEIESTEHSRKDPARFKEDPLDFTVQTAATGVSSLLPAIGGSMAGGALAGSAILPGIGTAAGAIIGGAIAGGFQIFGNEYSSRKEYDSDESRGERLAASAAWTIPQMALEGYGGSVLGRSISKALKAKKLLPGVVKALEDVADEGVDIATRVAAAKTAKEASAELTKELAELSVKKAMLKGHFTEALTEGAQSAVSLWGEHYSYDPYTEHGKEIRSWDHRFATVASEAYAGFLLGGGVSGLSSSMQSRRLNQALKRTDAAAMAEDQLRRAGERAQRAEETMAAMPGRIADAKKQILNIQQVAPTEEGGKPTEQPMVQTAQEVLDSAAQILSGEYSGKTPENYGITDPNDVDGMWAVVEKNLTASIGSAAEADFREAKTLGLDVSKDAGLELSSLNRDNQPERPNGELVLSERGQELWRSNLADQIAYNREQGGPMSQLSMDISWTMLQFQAHNLGMTPDQYLKNSYQTAWDSKKATSSMWADQEDGSRYAAFAQPNGTYTVYKLMGEKPTNVKHGLTKDAAQAFIKSKAAFIHTEEEVFGVDESTTRYSEAFTRDNTPASTALEAMASAVGKNSKTYGYFAADLNNRRTAMRIIAENLGYELVREAKTGRPVLRPVSYPQEEQGRPQPQWSSLATKSYPERVKRDPGAARSGETVNFDNLLAAKRLDIEREIRIWERIFENRKYDEGAKSAEGKDISGQPKQFIPQRTTKDDISSESEAKSRPSFKVLTNKLAHLNRMKLMSDPELLTELVLLRAKEMKYFRERAANELGRRIKGVVEKAAKAQAADVKERQADWWAKRWQQKQQWTPTPGDFEQAPTTIQSRKPKGKPRRASDFVGPPEPAHIPVDKLSDAAALERSVAEDVTPLPYRHAGMGVDLGNGDVLLSIVGGPNGVTHVGGDVTPRSIWLSPTTYRTREDLISVVRDNDSFNPDEEVMIRDDDTTYPSSRPGFDVVVQSTPDGFIAGLAETDSSTGRMIVFPNMREGITTHEEAVTLANNWLGVEDIATSETPFNFAGSVGEGTVDAPVRLTPEEIEQSIAALDKNISDWHTFMRKQINENKGFGNVIEYIQGEIREARDARDRYRAMHRRAVHDSMFGGKKGADVSSKFIYEIMRDNGEIVLAVVQDYTLGDVEMEEYQQGREYERSEKAGERRSKKVNVYKSGPEVNAWDPMTNEVINIEADTKAIVERINTLVTEAEVMGEVKDEYVIADAIGVSDTAVGEVMDEGARESRSKGSLFGKTTFNQFDGRAYITLLENADTRTALHEMAHVWLRAMPVKAHKTITALLGDEKDEKYFEKHQRASRNVDEQFVLSFTRYLQDGYVPKGQKELVPLIETVALEMTRSYDTFLEAGKEPNMHPAITPGRPGSKAGGEMRSQDVSPLIRAKFEALMDPNRKLRERAAKAVKKTAKPTTKPTAKPSNVTTDAWLHGATQEDAGSIDELPDENQYEREQVVEYVSTPAGPSKVAPNGMRMRSFLGNIVPDSAKRAYKKWRVGVVAKETALADMIKGFDNELKKRGEFMGKDTIEALSSQMDSLMRNRGTGSEGPLQFGVRRWDPMANGGKGDWEVVHKPLAHIIRDYKMDESQIADINTMLRSLRQQELHTQSIDRGKRLAINKIELNKTEALIDRAIAGNYGTETYVDLKKKRKSLIQKIERDEAGVLPGAISDEDLSQAMRDEREVRARWRDSGRSFKDEILAPIEEIRSWYDAAVLDSMVEVGFMSEDRANRLKKESPFYAPMERLIKEDGKREYVLRQGIKVHRATKGFDGKTIEPLEAMAYRASQIQGALQTQRKVNALAQMVDHPVGREIMRKMGVETRADADRAKREYSPQLDVFKVWRPSNDPDNLNLVETEYVADRDLMDAVNLLPHPNLVAIMDSPYFRFVKAPAYLKRSTATLGLGFIMKNVLRDPFTAAVNDQYGFHYTDMLKVALGYTRLSSKAWRETVSAADTEFQAVSGGGASQQAVDLEDIMRHRKNWVYANRKPGVIGKAMSLKQKYGLFWAPVGALAELSGALERVTRVAVYMNAKQGGRQLWHGIGIPGTQGKSGRQVSLAEAAVAGREGSLDFQRKGPVGGFINSINAFFNAEIQDVSKHAQMLEKDPTGTLIRAAAYIILPAVANFAANKDDDDYWALPSWERAVFFHIKVGDGFYRLPRPIGLINALYGYNAQALMEMTFNTNPEATSEWLDTMIDQTPLHLAFSPGQDGYHPLHFDSYSDLLPDIIKPPLEVKSNYDKFRDRPIVPMSEEGVEPQYQGIGKLRAVERAIGKELSLSPYAVRHLGSGYATTMYGYASDLLNAGAELAGAEQPAGPPFGFGKAAGRTTGLYRGSPVGPSSAPVSYFYKNLEALRRAQDTLRKVPQEEKRRYAAKNPILEHSKYINGVYARYKKQREQLEKIYKSDLPDAELIDRALKVKQSMTQMTAMANDELRSRLSGGP